MGDKILMREDICPASFGQYLFLEKYTSRELRSQLNEIELMSVYIGWMETI